MERINARMRQTTIIADQRNNDTSGSSKMDRLAQRWVEIMLEQLQISKANKFQSPGAISVKSFDN